MEGKARKYGEKTAIGREIFRRRRWRYAHASSERTTNKQAQHAACCAGKFMEIMLISTDGRSKSARLHLSQ